MRQRSFQEAVADTSYYPLAAAAGLACFFIFAVVSPVVSRKVWKDYGQQSERVRVDWGSRVVSFVHATIVSLMSAYAHLYDDEMHMNPIWWDCSLVRAACAILVGYMIWDMLLLTYYYQYLGDTEYYFHHSVAICAYYYVVTYALLPYFANFRLMSEISTPFLNIRWFLLATGARKTGRPYFLNSVVLLVSFFFCRVLAIPLYWLRVLAVAHTDAFGSLGYTPLVLVVTCLVLDSLNLYWFYKLVREFLKLLPKVLLGGRAAGGSTGGGGGGTRHQRSSLPSVGKVAAGANRVKSG